MTETAQAPTQAQIDQDFTAALHEINSNLEVRRLLFVFSNVLLPALAIAMVDTLTGTYYPAHLLWLPLNILPLIGFILAFAGIFITAILTRCHYGLVVNGNKMDCVVHGQLQLKGLNWLGVTTNFVAMTALYAGAGLSLLLGALGVGWLALVGGGVLFLLLMLYLRINHGKANRLSQQLAANWQYGAVSVRYLEEHARKSLAATTADIAVIVVMAVAMFSGIFNGMTSIGAVADSLAIQPGPELIKTWGIPVLGMFALLSLLLSDRMVVRLRIALAEHAQRLAELRSEADTPWKFKLHERTFLLFILLHLLTSVSALLVSWDWYGQWPGIGTGVVVFIVGILWYPWQLYRARP